MSVGDAPESATASATTAVAPDGARRDSPPAPPDDKAPFAPRRFRPPTSRFRHEDRDWLRRRLSIATANALAWTVGLMPWFLRSWVGDRIGDVWRICAPTYRANVRENLRQALGNGVSETDLDGLVRGVFRINGRNFTDLFRMPHWTAGDFDRMVRIEQGWHMFEEAIGRGKGVVLVTAHLGAFDVVGHAIGARGYPLTALTGRTTTRFIFDAVNHLRRGHNVVTAEATPGGVRQVIRALRRGEVAGFLADYDFFRNGLPVTFFGRETTLPPGPIRIARDSGAQVIGAFARRTGEGYALTFAGPLDIARTRDLDADLAIGMARLVDMLEKAVGSMPDQWVILQRVWPDAPPPAVRVFPEGSPLESEILKRVDDLLPPPRT